MRDATQGEPKKLTVIYKEKVWTVLEGDGIIVSSYKNKARAMRRAGEKANAAVSRGLKVTVVECARDGTIVDTKLYPTVRKAKTRESGP